MVGELLTPLLVLGVEPVVVAELLVVLAQLVLVVVLACWGPGLMALLVSRAQTVRVVAVALAEATVPSSTLQQRLFTAAELLTHQVTSVVGRAHPTLLVTKSLLVAAEQ
jgi:hypothetical protein